MHDQRAFLAGHFPAPFGKPLFDQVTLGIKQEIGDRSGQGLTPAVAQEEGLELAVYNSDLALVKDRRSMDLTEGLNEVRFARDPVVLLVDDLGGPKD